MTSKSYDKASSVAMSLRDRSSRKFQHITIRISRSEAAVRAAPLNSTLGVLLAPTRIGIATRA